MKKNLNEIRGTLLTDKQMKSLRGGTVLGGPDPCATSVCPTNSTWKCVANKLGNCRCSGVNGQGAEPTSADCTNASTAPRDSTGGK